MTKTLNKGERVRWKSHGGEAHGKVVKKITDSVEIGGNTMRASAANPKYLLQTDEGKRAAHTATVLVRE
jgi:Hypervirulence associated proteins TUDOR domain